VVCRCIFGASAGSKAINVPPGVPIMIFNQINYLWRVITLAAILSSHPCTASAEGNGNPVTITADWAGYGMKTGPWWTYTNPWNRGSLVHGVDYNQSITVIPKAMPNGTVISWSWPNQIPSYIYSYPMLVYGVYDRGTSRAGVKPASMQISELTTLLLQHNVSIAATSGSVNDFDVIYDGYLSTTADGNTNAAEISVFIHTPNSSLTYMRGLSPRYTGYVDGDGVAWDMAFHGTQMCIWPHNGADVLVKTIDLKAMLSYLVTQGVLTGNEWFNGIAIGAEIIRNAGTLTVNSIEITFN
jgi:hypothetical protein